MEVSTPPETTITTRGDADANNGGRERSTPLRIITRGILRTREKSPELEKELYVFFVFATTITTPSTPLRI